MESSIDELQKYIGNLNDWLIDYKCYQDNIRVLKSVLVSICFVSMNALLLVFRVYRSVADPEIPANGACSQEGGGGVRERPLFQLKNLEKWVWVSCSVIGAARAPKSVTAGVAIFVHSQFQSDASLFQDVLCYV